MKKKLNPKRALTRNIAAMLQLASVSDIMEGIDWYERAARLARRLSGSYGCSFVQAVGVISALSPRNKWPRNCRDAESVIKAWSLGEEVLEVTCCTFGYNKQKAKRILEEGAAREDIIAILNGPKTVAFARSIFGEQSAVCVDGHAFAVWIGERVPLDQTPKIDSGGLYRRIAQDYCTVAKRSKSISGHQLTAAQVQAVTWVCYRRLMGIK